MRIKLGRCLNGSLVKLARYGLNCYPEGCAAPSFVQCQCNTQEPLSKLKRTSHPRKIHVTSKSPVGDISVVTLIRTDTTLDHSQKAEKVWRLMEQSWVSVRQQLNNVLYFLLLMAAGGEVLEDILESMANDAACCDA